MKDTAIVEKTELKLKNAYLVVGLPGIALIGKTASDYMIKKLKGKKVAELYSHHFPHQVFMSKKGTLRPIKNTFYHVKIAKKDLIVLVGDVQAITSVGQYEITGKILDYCQKIGVKTIITIGGYSSGRLEGNLRVFGLTTNKLLIPKLEKAGAIFGVAKGSIVGAAGLLPVFGKIRGLDGICLLGETHGAYVDASSARDILKVLMKYLDFQLDLAQIEQKAKEGEKIVKKIEEELKRTSVQLPPPEAGRKDVSYIR
ncbi:proteasome assembly chaperone family protein [Candidatus Micrarchaeota archaeon]|nr:proteasome assembly chaperone family protein [Candidatus Micrarchaeota archaeon]